MNWKKGRGKLGVFKPLIGNWISKSDSPLGPVVCTRQFSQTLKDKYIELKADWDTNGRIYQEKALFGFDKDKVLSFWSFTSDGKNSFGQVCEMADIHPHALCFMAQMPAGIARQVYWPNEEGEGFFWVVESQTKMGWNRFVKHHYLPL